jgi:hypothetical protein
MKKRRIESKNGWFFLQIGGTFYSFMIQLGRVTFSVEQLEAAARDRAIRRLRKMMNRYLADAGRDS